MPRKSLLPRRQRAGRPRGKGSLRSSPYATHRTLHGLAPAEHVVKVLADRRDKIVRAFIDTVLPLANFRTRGDYLLFDDLGAAYGFANGAIYTAAIHTPRLRVRARVEFGC